MANPGTPPRPTHENMDPPPRGRQNRPPPLKLDTAAKPRERSPTPTRPPSELQEKLSAAMRRIARDAPASSSPNPYASLAALNPYGTEAEDLPSLPATSPRTTPRTTTPTSGPSTPTTSVPTSAPTSAPTTAPTTPTTASPAPTAPTTASPAMTPRAEKHALDMARLEWEMDSLHEAIEAEERAALRALRQLCVVSNTTPTQTRRPRADEAEDNK
ncbi:hypothetical protein F4802DRAFT_597052 [Xylaria palmicola]|nr:hypothetical protein F4802DRAFT_597052 [Xylaria palmicola]